MDQQSNGDHTQYMYNTKIYLNLVPLLSSLNKNRHFFGRMCVCIGVWALLVRYHPSYDLYKSRLNFFFIIISLLTYHNDN